MTPVLVFDIETVPDVAGLRVLHDIGAEVSDEAVAQQAFDARRDATGSDFLPLHLHRVVSISCVLRDRDALKVWSLGEPNEPEGQLIQRFFDGIERYTPQLVSWNGSGFDLPVLNYRGLMHGVVARRFWDLGDDDRDFKWNNYISRYHMRHLDLMDLLAMYQPRASAPLDAMAQLMGYPGKLGMDGSKVWEAYLAGRIEQIRNYCETDVLNTYLVYLRFQLMRGVLDKKAHAMEVEFTRSQLQRLQGSHWQEFLSRWPA